MSSSKLILQIGLLQSQIDAINKTLDAMRLDIGGSVDIDQDQKSYIIVQQPVVTKTNTNKNEYDEYDDEDDGYDDDDNLRKTSNPINIPKLRNYEFSNLKANCLYGIDLEEL